MEEQEKRENAIGDSFLFQQAKREHAINPSKETEDKLRSLANNLSLQSNHSPVNLSFQTAVQDPLSGAKTLAFLSEECQYLQGIFERWDDLVALLKNQSDPNVIDSLLLCILNLSKSKEYCVPLFSKILDTLDFLLAIPSESKYFILGTVFHNYENSTEFNWTIAKLGFFTIYRTYANMSVVSPAAFSSLLKMLGKKEIVEDFLNQEFLIERLIAAGSHSDSMLVVGLFTRFLDSLDCDVASDYFVKLVRNLMVSNQILGVITLSALLQANPSIGSSILAKEGILTDILDAAEFESSDYQQATVELISNSCVSENGRKLVTAASQSFLSTCARQTANIKLQIYSICALVKLSIVDRQVQSLVFSDSAILDLLGKVIIDGGELKEIALQALSAMTLAGPIKQQVVENPVLFDAIKTLLSSEGPVLYSTLIICENISAYPKTLTQEQLQLQQLHQLANNLPANNPLNEPQAVSKRVDALVKAGFVPILSTVSSSSANMNLCLARIYLSIVTDQSHRGLVVQGGGVKKLLSIARSKSKEVCLDAAQALAKIAITTDPTKGFTGEIAMEMIRPFIFLLEEGSGLLQFESLMALTNLAGVEERLRDRILRLGGLSSIEKLQFSTNIMIRRAATELICNLVYHPEVFTAFLTENSQLLKIMFALCDDEDFETVRAASGTIAVLSSEPASIPFILNCKRFEEVLSTLLSTNHPEILHRAIEIVKNINAVQTPPSAVLSVAKKLTTCEFKVVAEIAKSL